MRALKNIRVNYAIFVILGIALSSCSGSDAIAGNRQESTGAISQSVVDRPSDAHKNQTKGRLMLGSKHCGITETERSACMIEMIIADIRANYKGAGGGITSIKAGVGDSYSVTLPQEERTDIFTYEFETHGEQITLKSKKESTESH